MIREFEQSALVMDAQVVAFSYRPIQPPGAVQIVEAMQRDPAGDAYYVHVKSDSDRRTSKLDQPDKFLDKNIVLSHLTRANTLLGVAAFQYEPKPNVVDFIEDLSLAGIRFCFFSGESERESKAYAERLGLEIDWNSCVILSPKGSGQGYLALHDMKSKLPHGLGEIQHHLEQVDDVPLHVSLFAECAPQTTREMIRIFQQYGDTVCCIGSSLNQDNVECFALVFSINTERH